MPSSRMPSADRRRYLLHLLAQVPDPPRRRGRRHCLAGLLAVGDHVRRARRTIKVTLVPAWIEFEGAAQVAQLRRTVTRKGKKTVEVVYLITSDRGADPAALAAWARGHREIENRLHRASETLRRFTTLRPRCGSGRRACWAWRQRLSC
jgi:hypothetical protein